MSTLSNSISQLQKFQAKTIQPLITYPVWKSLSKKITFRLQEDKPTTPIELHVQSAGVSEEEQVVFTEDGDETEEQLLQREKEAWF